MEKQNRNDGLSTPREIIPQAGRAQGPAGHGKNAAGTNRENSRLSGKETGSEGHSAEQASSCSLCSPR